MKDLLIKLALDTARNLIVPAIKEYALKTPGKLDDLFANTLAAVLNDPILVDILQQKGL